MSHKPEEKAGGPSPLRQVLERLRHLFAHNWPLKLLSVGLSILLWGGLISQDGNLTREKLFTDVAISAVNGDVLQRNGLIVTEGLADLAPIQMRAAVPQRSYGTALASNYNVRVDLSRITAPGEQLLPILTSSTGIYGQVTWLSAGDVKVMVDDYITRRRIPVQLNIIGQAPAGFYAATPVPDPALVVISGPRHVTETVTQCVVTYNLSNLAAQAGTQIVAAPFELHDAQSRPVDSSLISITSESILLDTILVDQKLYAKKTVDINLSGAVVGEPALGYTIGTISANPSYLQVAGSADFLKGLTQLDLSNTIDIAGATENLVRAVKVVRPQGATYLGEETIYVTVEIVKADPKPEVAQ